MVVFFQKFVFIDASSVSSVKKSTRASSSVSQAGKVTQAKEKLLKNNVTNVDAGIYSKFTNKNGTKVVQEQILSVTK